MTEKVKVSKEVAEVIEILKDAKRPLHEMVKHYLNDDFIWTLEFKCLDNLSNDDFIRALYVGYEVEQTPEEKILAEYNWHKPFDCSIEGGIYREGMKFVLNAYNIRIKGVNA